MVDGARPPADSSGFDETVRNLRRDDTPGEAFKAAYRSERPRDEPAHRRSKPRLRIALAHDRLVDLRGAERVLERLAALVIAEHVPANLSVLFHRKGPYGVTLDRLEVRASRLNRLPGAAGGLRRWLLPLYPGAIDALGDRLARDHAEQAIDLLISTSSGLIKGLPAPEGVPHLCYCHAPAPYLWSSQDAYTAGPGLWAPLRRLGFGVFTEPLRRWDRKTVANVSTFVANSRHTAREIERCWGRGSIVIPPPVRTDFFTPDPATRREDFWLVVASLERRKQVEIAIDAALLAGKRLFVVGRGSQAARLRASTKRAAKRMEKAGKPGRKGSIEFSGHVGDEHLRTLYRRASVLIMPQVENFGIAAVEAQACGCPVVARRAGGALDTVLEGRTGAFFDRPEPSAIVEAVRRLPRDVAVQCRANAERFAQPKFDDAIRQAIRETAR